MSQRKYILEAVLMEVKVVEEPLLASGKRASCCTSQSSSDQSWGLQGRLCSSSNWYGHLEELEHT